MESLKILKYWSTTILEDSFTGMHIFLGNGYFLTWYAKLGLMFRTLAPSKLITSHSKRKIPKTMTDINYRGPILIFFTLHY